MNKICKKLLTVLAAMTLMVSAVAFSSCNYYYKALDGDYSSGTVSSQGGWVVQKGEYIYYINGTVTQTTDDDGNVTTDYGDNDFGDVVRASLMRIKESDMDNGEYDKSEIVVPLMLVAADYSSGIYIYGDYVYYATPTTAMNLEGQTENTYVDFKRSRLDGKKTMRGYYFRSSDSTQDYRFVEVNDVVYCLHMDGSDLYSYNTEEKEDVLLAKGISSWTFNSDDVSDPYVYYTIGVTEDIDQASSVTENYQQLYRVRADATYELDRKNADFTVTGYTSETTDENGGTVYTQEAEGSYTYTYEYDRDSLDDLQDEAEDADNGDEMEDFSPGDIDTYPYVNLGQLVLDGIGSINQETQYNHSSADSDAEDTSEAYTPDGYTYSLIDYKNGGLYYTRQLVGSGGITGESGWTYYLAEDKFSGSNIETWNTVTGNADTSGYTDGTYSDENNDLIAITTTYANASSFFYMRDGEHYYLYTDSSNLVRAKVGENGTAEKVIVGKGASVTQFLFLDDDSSSVYDYVYYTTSSTNGIGVGRAVYDSSESGYEGNEEAFYHKLTGKDEYQPVTILGIDHPSEWYPPELIGNRLFVLDTTAVGSITINMPEVINLDNSSVIEYATEVEGVEVNSAEQGDSVMTNAEIEVFNDMLDTVSDVLSDATSFSSRAGNAVYYYYYTGDTDLFWTVIEEWIDDYEDDGYGPYSVFSEREQDYFTAYYNCDDYVVNTVTTAEFTKACFLLDEDEEVWYDSEGETVYFGVRSYFYTRLGSWDEDSDYFAWDEDEYEDLIDAWRINYLESYEVDDSLETWVWVLIGIAIGVGVVGIACGITIPLVIHYRRKRRLEEGEEPQVKRKKYDVNMEADEDIDVYAFDDMIKEQEARQAQQEQKADVPEDLTEDLTEEEPFVEPDTPNSESGGDGEDGTKE